MEIYQQTTGMTDAIAMQHDVDYSICKDDKKCKNKADRKMVKALDSVPYDKSDVALCSLYNVTVLLLYKQRV